MKSKKIQKFIKCCILEIITNSDLDHRNYNVKPKIKSPLIKKIKKNGNSFDLGIKLISDDIAINEKIVNLCHKINILDDEDEIEEIRIDLFYEFVLLSGLFELTSLHGDDYDAFKDKFYEMVK
jgi:hypothetical protein